MNFKFIRKPFEFIKSHFRTEFTSKQSTGEFYIISSNLSTAELEKGEHLKLLNVYSSGWKISNDGYIELNSENKVSTFSHYYLIKRSTQPTIGLNMIELCLSCEEPACLLQIYAISKKNQHSTVTNRLYLKN